jgi:hypothetical protein
MKIVRLMINPENAANNIPKIYKALITNAECFGKNADEKSAYMGSFALQLINGVRRIVIFLSRALDSVRVAIIAGTLQPKPTRTGTKLLPDKPILRSGLSIIYAMRADRKSVV